MADLTQPLAAFLDDHGWGGAAVSPMAGDASFRRYFRVAQGDRRAIVMDAPPPHEDVRPFLAVGRWLEEHAFRTPAIWASDIAAGRVLLEDLGDRRFRETVEASPAEEMALYARAVDLLARLAGAPAGPFPPYDAALLTREVDLFVDWYAPAVGLAVDRDGWRAAWNAVLPLAHAASPVTVLRDYHAENIMLVEPAGTLALLDFQDAVTGHAAYDLVSLLQDARRDVDPAVEAAMLARYGAATGTDAGFGLAYHVLGAQRPIKILGIFTRLWRRDGKPRYPALCPRVWRYLERDLAHPALAPVAAWFAANVPPDRRGDPLVLSA